MAMTKREAEVAADAIEVFVARAVRIELRLLSDDEEHQLTSLQRSAITHERALARSDLIRGLMGNR